jgi:hypothetical protein
MTGSCSSACLSGLVLPCLVHMHACFWMAPHVFSYDLHALLRKDQTLKLWDLRRLSSLTDMASFSDGTRVVIYSVHDKGYAPISCAASFC